MFRKQSDSIAKFACAFKRAQEEMTGAKKGSTNPHFRSRYADLPAVMEAVMPALNKHGISVLQFPGFDHETKLVSVETLLVHNSGEWVAGTCSALPKDHKNVQAVGSTITYLKRYGLQSMTGCPSEDDDGNAASPPPRQQRRTRRQPPAPPPTDYQSRCKELNLDPVKLVHFLVDNGRPAPKNMSPQQLSNMWTWLAGAGADEVRAHVRPTDG